MNRVSTGLEQLKNILQGDLDPVQKNSMEYIGDVVNEKGSGLEKGLFSLTDNITAMGSLHAGGRACWRDADRSDLRRKFLPRLQA